MFEERPKYICYQDESGIDVDNRYFIIGILIINKKEANNFREIVCDIRNKHNFKNEIHFAKTSKLRYAVLIEIDIIYGDGIHVYSKR